MTLQIYALVGVCSIVAGFLTASIGFGGAIFLMLFFPKFIPFVNSTGLSSTIVYGEIILLAYEYRKYTQWKELRLPVLLYVMCSIPMIFSISKFNTDYLKLCFSILIMIIGLYYLFGTIWPEKIRFKKNLLTTVLCSCLSGISTGLFGIGGPPMAGYFMAVTGDDKKAYIGTIQSFFAISMFFSITARFCAGVMTKAYIPMAVVGFAMSLIGKKLGTFTLNRINQKMLKIGICAFMILSQFITLAECVSA